MLDKVREKQAECEQSITTPANTAAQTHEVGDLLFAGVNLAFLCSSAEMERLWEQAKIEEQDECAS